MMGSVSSTRQQSNPSVAFLRGSIFMQDPAVQRFTGHPLEAIRNLDYTILFARDMERMRGFYSDVMRFPIYYELSSDWIEYRVGANLLVLSRAGLHLPDPVPAKGTATVQLAFRIRREEIDRCAQALISAGVELVSSPADQPWGHRTVFFRDPDGNLLEIYADI
jgi:lactoylglutathione lyase